MNESPDRAEEEKIAKALEEVFASISSGGAREVERLGPERRERVRALRVRNKLRKRYGAWLLGLVVAQLVVVNAAFVAYAWAGRDWNVPDGVMLGFIGATVVELIAVAHVVVRSLFPPDES